MNKSIFLLSVHMFFTSMLYAQDKNDIAITLHEKAYDAFNNADYETALKSLEQAEQELGNTNTKILHLKIKTLDMLSQADDKYIPALQQSLTAFFSLADKNTYPPNKYTIAVLIDERLKQHLQEVDAFKR